MQSNTSNHNNQKKIALINDITGFGRCSVAVQLPIISQLGVQCCVLPTSILSNHTGFPSYSFQDFTPHMEEHIAEWRKLNLQFRGICTGFLGSAEQISIVRAFIDEFGGEGCVTLVDPVMGDEGKAYGTYTPEMCERMAELVAHADIITPNITEACILTKQEYNPHMSFDDVFALARKLCDMGPSKVVITGVEHGATMTNACFERGMEPFTATIEKLGGQRSGTGDVFSAVIAADAVNGVSFKDSVNKATAFARDCVQASIDLGIPRTDGLAFEEKLHTLARQHHANATKKE